MKDYAAAITNINNVRMSLSFLKVYVKLHRRKNVCPI